MPFAPDPDPLAGRAHEVRWLHRPRNPPGMSVFFVAKGQEIIR